MNNRFTRTTRTTINGWAPMALLWHGTRIVLNILRMAQNRPRRCRSSPSIYHHDSAEERNNEWQAFGPRNTEEPKEPKSGVGQYRFWRNSPEIGHRHGAFVSIWNEILRKGCFWWWMDGVIEELVTESDKTNEWVVCSVKLKGKTTR